MNCLSLKADKAGRTKTKSAPVWPTGRRRILKLSKILRKSSESKKKNWVFKIYYNGSYIGHLTTDGRYFSGTEKEATSEADRLYNDYIGEGGKKAIKIVPVIPC